MGFIILLAEFVVFCVWNATEVNRFATSADFAGYLQAVYLFLHGKLGMVGTAGFLYSGHASGFSFWKVEAELDVVPLSLGYLIWPHPVVLKWIQDAALVGAQAIAFAWICELVASRARRLDQADSTERRLLALVPLVGLILLVCNPWFVWSSSFDLHSEPLAGFFVLGAARAMYYGRRRAWVWAIAGVLCSAVGATYIAAAAIAAVISGRGRAKLAAKIAAIALVWFAIVTALHLVSVGSAAAYASILNGGAQNLHNLYFDQIYSSKLSYTTVVKAAVEHPLNVLKALWANHLNLWAPFAAPGILGIVWVPVLVPTVFVLIEGGFARDFSLPSFQNIVVGGLVAVGTIAILLRLLDASSVRRRRLGWIVAAVLIADTGLWAATWFPQVGSTWLKVDRPAALVLASVRSKIAPDDEVVASQGIAGGFAYRQSVYALTNAQMRIQLRERHVWFILAPEQGIETWDVSRTLTAIKQLEALPGIKLITQSSGIWAFEWTPPKRLRMTYYFLGKTEAVSIPGSILAGPSGVPVRSKSAYSSSTGHPGYVIDQAYERRLAGTYRATVRLSASTTTNVEVWDSTTSTLLGRVTVDHTRGIHDVSLVVSLRHVVNLRSYAGWGLWGIEPIVRTGDALETRVWSGKARPGAVKVYSVGLTRVR